MESNSSYQQLTACEIIDLVQNRKVSVSEIISEFIYISKFLNPYLQAWTSIDYDYIRHQVSELPNKNIGKMHGVPVGIKDIFNTYYYPTQKGAAYWKNYKAGNDARCVSYLRDEHAIIFGKTDTAELAVHANGLAINPHNNKFVTGSSSNGSAAAVAAAMVPIALGSQTGGSIIRPASWCGIYAMKPSFGLISRTGVLKTTDTLDSIGFFTRCIADLELMLDVMRIKGDNFPIQEKKLSFYKTSKKRKWKIAFCTGHKWFETDQYVKKDLIDYVDSLRMHSEIEIVELNLPHETQNCHQLHKRLYYPCLSYYLKKEYMFDPHVISDSLKQIFFEANLIPPEDYAIALREQELLANKMEAFFKDNEVDAIIINSSNGSAPISEPDIHNDLNMLWTMSWLPVVNVPKFMNENDMPFGFSLIGPRYSDYTLISLLKHLQNFEFIPKKAKIAKPKIEIEKNKNVVMSE